MLVDYFKDPRNGLKESQQGFIHGEVHLGPVVEVSYQIHRAKALKKGGKSHLISDIDAT